MTQELKRHVLNHLSTRHSSVVELAITMPRIAWAKISCDAVLQLLEAMASDGLVERLATGIRPGYSVYALTDTGREEVLRASAN